MSLLMICIKAGVFHQVWFESAYFVLVSYLFVTGLFFIEKAELITCQAQLIIIVYPTIPLRGIRSISSYKCDPDASISPFSSSFHCHLSYPSQLTYISCQLPHPAPPPPLLLNLSPHLFQPLLSSSNFLLTTPYPSFSHSGKTAGQL